MKFDIQINNNPKQMCFKNLKVGDAFLTCLSDLVIKTDLCIKTSEGTYVVLENESASTSVVTLYSADTNCMNLLNMVEPVEIEEMTIKVNRY